MTGFHFSVTLKLKTIIKKVLCMKSSTLKETTVGTCTTIVEFAQSIPSKTRQRLQDLGISPTRSVTVLRRTPFGGPISISVGGLVMALDIQIAQHIVVSAT